MVGSKIDKVDLENLTEHKISKDEAMQMIPSLDQLEEKLNHMVTEV